MFSRSTTYLCRFKAITCLKKFAYQKANDVHLCCDAQTAFNHGHCLSDSTDRSERGLHKGMNIRCSPSEDTKLSLPHKVPWVSDFCAWMDGGATHRNGSTHSVASISIKNPCTLYEGWLCFNSLFLRIAFTDTSYWINPFVIDSQGSLGRPLWHSSSWESLSKISLPISCELQEPWAGSHLSPDLHPKSSAHLAHSKFSIFPELNLISIFLQMKGIIMPMYYIFKLRLS